MAAKPLYAGVNRLTRRLNNTVIRCSLHAHQRQTAEWRRMAAPASSSAIKLYCLLVAIGGHRVCSPRNCNNCFSPSHPPPCSTCCTATPNHALAPMDWLAPTSQSTIQPNQSATQTATQSATSPLTSPPTSTTISPQTSPLTNPPNSPPIPVRQPVFQPVCQPGSQTVRQ